MPLEKAKMPMLGLHQTKHKITVSGPDLSADSKPVLKVLMQAFFGNLKKCKIKGSYSNSKIGLGIIINSIMLFEMIPSFVVLYGPFHIVGVKLNFGTDTIIFRTKNDR